MELLVPSPLASNPAVRVSVPKNGTLKDLGQSLAKELQLTGITFLCNEKNRLPESTPIDLLLNRYFYVSTN